MSFIGDFLKAGIEVDGESFKFNAKLLLNYEEITGTDAGVALDLKKNLHLLTTGSTTENFTLAVGKAGQVKIIVLVTKVTDNAVVTAVFTGAGVTLTFDTAGEGAVLVSDGTSWHMVATNGAAIT